MSIWNMSYIWEPLWAPALDRVLRSWEGTPYWPGQAIKGVGVDCVRFVCEVYRELGHLPSIPLIEIPADAAMHSRETAVAAMKRIIAAYNFRRVQTLQPGDVLVVGPCSGGPGHAMIAGTEKNVLWHASPAGVVRSGTGLSSSYRPFGIYRVEGKDQWNQ